MNKHFAVPANRRHKETSPSPHAISSQSVRPLLDVVLGSGVSPAPKGSEASVITSIEKATGLQRASYEHESRIRAALAGRIREYWSFNSTTDICYHT